MCATEPTKHIWVINLNTNMIKVNNVILEQKHFPDGSLMMMDFPSLIVKNDCNIVTWQYESDSELFTLICVAKHIRKITNNKSDIMLEMPFLAHARMDRVKSQTEVFTLKYFCEIINSLNFSKVIVLDPHSNVGVALLNNIVVKSPERLIDAALYDIEGGNIDGGQKYSGTTVIYFPDEGAMKRYSDMSVFKDRTIVYGHKIREWKTGEIVGLKIRDRDGEEILRGSSKNPVNGKVVLMVDDIISYGGTLAYSADGLRKLGASAVYAYASHTENSILNAEKGKLLDRLNSGAVDELFTTDSLYHDEHPRITVLNTD